MNFDDFDDIIDLIKEKSGLTDLLDDNNFLNTIKSSDENPMEKLHSACKTSTLTDFDIIGIVAMDKNGVIGINDDLPWHLKDDLQNFKKQTANCGVIMGRRTFDSLPFADGLPNRTNYVITRDSNVALIPEIKYKEKTKSTVVRTGSLNLAIETTKNVAKMRRFIDGLNEEDAKVYENLFAGKDENIDYSKIFIIGGSEIFNLAAELSSDNFITKMIVTEVDTEVQYDESSDKVSKLNIDTDLIWKEVKRTHFEKNDDNEHAFDIVEYERQCNIIGI